MTIFKDINIASPFDKFGNVRVENKTPQVNLKSIYGESVIRDISTTAGSGTITTGSGEYVISTGTTTGSSALLDSVERGRYQSGTSAEFGIGVRLNTGTFTGTAYAQWGYYDDDDGIGYGVDATGIYVFIRRGGSDTKTYQASWNIDTLDGTSRYTALDLTDGNIYQTEFSWYGYGVIDFEVITSNGNFTQVPVSVHRFIPNGANSIESPNLPLRVEVDNGNTTTDFIVYVGGRQFSVHGNYQPDTRETTEYRLQQGSINTTFVPCITFRQKSSFQQVSIRARGFDIITDADLVYAVFIGGTLTGASFGGLNNVPANETALEVDTSATAISSTDTALAQGLVSTTGGGARAIGSLTNAGLGFNIPENNTVTLAVRRISGTGATVSTVFKLTEEW